MVYLLGYTANSKNKSVLLFPTNIFFLCLAWFAFSLSHFKCSKECSTWKKRNTCRYFSCRVSRLAEDDFELLLYSEREYRDLKPELMSRVGYVLCLGSSSFLLDKCSVLNLRKKMQRATNDVRIFYKRNWESSLCIGNQNCWLFVWENRVIQLILLFPSSWPNFDGNLVSGSGMLLSELHRKWYHDQKWCEYTGCLCTAS